MKFPFMFACLVQSVILLRVHGSNISVLSRRNCLVADVLARGQALTEALTILLPRLPSCSLDFCVGVLFRCIRWGWTAHGRVSSASCPVAVLCSGLHLLQEEAALMRMRAVLVERASVAHYRFLI